VQIVMTFCLCLNSRMATLDTDDLKTLKDLMEATFEEKLDEKLDDKLNHLPTKDEFYTKMDEVMGELKTIREEQAVQSHQLSNHEDRIEKLESHLGFPSN
jgi:predicted nuclease with TOPRIM domain